MKYIEKVILENFQSHKNSTIEFDDQLNVIVGPSDSGKTAILRGIRWALYNEPSGDYFIREGTSECSVTIIFNDGTKIKRYRNKSKNTYFLYDSNNNEMKFEGFGTSVPEEIINKTGIKKILLDSDLSNAINLSDQLEGAFLLSERASARANSIGRLVGVNIIDDALRESLKDSRNLSNNKKNIEDNIVQLEKELLTYEYLDELASRINNIEKIKNKIQEKNETISKYKDLLQKTLTISQEKKELNFYIKKLENIDRVSTILGNISSNITMFNYLSKQRDVINNLHLNKQEAFKVVTCLKNINIAEKNITTMTSLQDLRIKLANYNLKFKKLSYEIGELKVVSYNLRNINILQNRINAIDNNIYELKKLTTIKDKEFALRGRLAIGIKYVERLQEIDNVFQIYIRLSEKITLLNQLKGLSTTYTSNKDEITKEKLSLQKYKDEVEEQISNYKELLLKQETCPLCFSIIDNDKIKHIISHYN